MLDHVKCGHYKLEVKDIRKLKTTQKQYFILINIQNFFFIVLDNVQGWHGTKMVTPWQLYRTKMVIIVVLSSK